MTIEYGDKVHYALDGFEGIGFCIGYPNYAKDGSVIVLAGDDYFGMPINAKWCKAIGSNAFDKAGVLRGRFIDKFGDKFLVPR